MSSSSGIRPCHSEVSRVRAESDRLCSDRCPAACIRKQRRDERAATPGTDPMRRLSVAAGLRLRVGPLERAS
jgi:hypothetical protein